MRAPSRSHSRPVRALVELHYLLPKWLLPRWYRHGRYASRWHQRFLVYVGMQLGMHECEWCGHLTRSTCCE